MALRSTAHKQIQAIKLRELLSASPLVLIYQTIGNVRSSDLTDAINEQLKKESASAQLHASSVKVKNSIVAQAGTMLSPYFQANNLLVGWRSTAHGAESSSPQSSAHGGGRARRRDTLSDMLAGPEVPGSSAGRPSASTRAAAGFIPHSALTRAIDLSLGLQSKQPVALLAGFYR